MEFPILAYGHPNLRKIAEDIDKDYPGLDELIENMFASMYNSHGVGLAAPQINKSIRLFVIDASPYAEDAPETKDFKKVFINAHILDESGEEWGFEEGCLSVPKINEVVNRKGIVRIKYVDQNFVEHDEVYGGLLARIIQHEYDHLDGILFVDRLPLIKKTMLKRKLNEIAKGEVDVEYRMVFPLQKKARK